MKSLAVNATKRLEQAAPMKKIQKGATTEALSFRNLAVCLKGLPDRMRKTDKATLITKMKEFKQLADYLNKTGVALDKFASKELDSLENMRNAGKDLQSLFYIQDYLDDILDGIREAEQSLTGISIRNRAVKLKVLSYNKLAKTLKTLPTKMGNVDRKTLIAKMKEFKTVVEYLNNTLNDIYFHLHTHLDGIQADSLADTIKYLAMVINSVYDAEENLPE